MDEKCCYQLEKPRKRQREGSKRKSTRLSDLPDSILHHILSFLTSKWAVQTSVLSRRWRCLWKYVPVLNLLSYSFFEYSQFVNFVDKVLSLRYQFKLDEITLEDFDDQSLDLYQKVIQYALSHDARHLVICIDSAIDFADLFGSMVYSNLESLVLTYICFNFGPSCFPKLTTLKLNGCLLVGPIDSDHDLSVKFPCLVNLDITDSEPSHFATRLKLYAPQLLNFKLSGSELLNIDVVAPRLESFILEPDYPSCDLVYVMQNQLCCVAIPLRCVGRFESFWSRSCLPLRD
ncbi:Putative FBD-associated F-box protein At5g22720 [Linum perenne]